MKIYFSDFFNVSEETLRDFGAFNISLINDLPVFIDPFLLFNSDKEEYQALHHSIIDYLSFLKQVSETSGISKGNLRHWFLFPEVKQSWLGFCLFGNSGSGLGKKFAKALNENFSTILEDFGTEQISASSHLEKLCLIRDGVGKDNISDFTANLIKEYLCKYTQDFCLQHLDNNQTKKVNVPHIYFNYELRRWFSKEFTLPFIDGDYVLLTPRDMLTKDETWINKHDLLGDFEGIIESLPNEQLRAQINDYFLRQIPLDGGNSKEIKEAKSLTLKNYPEILNYFIKNKEAEGDEATKLSDSNLDQIETVFIEKLRIFVEKLFQESDFYVTNANTYSESYQRVLYLKQVIENNDGYRVFYHNGKPIKREADLQVMFRLCWFAAEPDVNSEVNNGRGPVDYKISRGSKDSTLVEFKLASNTKLKQNLEKQVEVYQAANKTDNKIKVILYFSDDEYERVKRIMKELKLTEGEDLVLIDAQRSNKPSASNVK